MPTGQSTGVQVQETVVNFRGAWRTGAEASIASITKETDGHSGGIGTLLLTVPLVVFMACSSLPALETQKQLIQRGDLQVQRLTPRAFVETWGDPTYMRQEFTHFFVMNDGSLIPQSRLALGESPKGWETGLEAGDSLFLAYADRGWYLVFYEDRLVYREAMPASAIHAVGKGWKYEEQFKTQLEMAPPHR
jgi:hypothetical protein